MHPSRDIANPQQGNPLAVHRAASGLPFLRILRLEFFCHFQKFSPRYNCCKLLDFQITFRGLVVDETTYIIKTDSQYTNTFIDNLNVEVRQ